MLVLINSRTQTGEGLRPPHYVVKAKSKEGFEVLIKTGADLSARTPPRRGGVLSLFLFLYCLGSGWVGRVNEQKSTHAGRY